jgi:anionic cell wall polymer biosynthesis LytR-Cps2A-Psr (LCP) family protein
MWKRFLLGGVLIFVLSVAVVATAALEQFQQIADILPKGGARIVSADLTPSEAGAPQTIMVIGSDKRAKASAIQDRVSPPHSDTLMLIRMDPSKGAN